VVYVQQVNAIAAEEPDGGKHIPHIPDDPIRFVLPTPDHKSHSHSPQERQNRTIGREQQYQLVAVAVDQADIR
jgi:hypothetical protein